MHRSHSKVGHGIYVTIESTKSQKEQNVRICRKYVTLEEKPH